jgi:hypothetical protein
VDPDLVGSVRSVSHSEPAYPNPGNDPTCVICITLQVHRVVDPYSFFTDPDTDPDPIRIQGFNDQKLKKKKQLKKKLNFSKHEFFLLLWVIFALLDPDPDPYSNYGSGSGSMLPIEYGSNTDPDPDPQPGGSYF